MIEFNEPNVIQISIHERTDKQTREYVLMVFEDKNNPATRMLSCRIGMPVGFVHPLDTSPFDWNGETKQLDPTRFYSIIENSSGKLHQSIPTEEEKEKTLQLWLTGNTEITVDPDFIPALQQMRLKQLYRAATGSDRARLRYQLRQPA